MDRRGSNPFLMGSVSGQYDWSYREYDAKCWAEYYGVPFREPVPFRTDPTVLPLACLAADTLGALVPCCRALHRMIFVDGAIIDDAAIAALPRLLGMNPNMFKELLEAPETRMRHDALLDEAIARGAFGVPTFFLGEHMFWGNDRLVLLEAALGGIAMPSIRSRGAPRARARARTQRTSAIARTLRLMGSINRRGKSCSSKQRRK